MSKRSKLLVILLAMVMVLTLVAAGCGQKAEEPKQTGETQQPPAKPWYEGKTITFVVGRTAGGGFDAYTRIMAPGIQKYLPGSTVIVKNMPGAGGIVAMNDVFNNAKPDGTTIQLEGVGNMLLPEVIGDESVKYKSDEFIMLGQVSTDPHIFMVGKDSKIKSMDDLKKITSEVTFAATGKGSDDYFAGYLLFDALGVKIKPVAGYGGAAEARMATIIGETQTFMASYGGSPELKSGELVPLMSLTRERIKELPNVPSVTEVVTDKEKLKDLLAIADVFELDRIIMTVPGTPENIVKDLREAVEKAAKDPEIIATANTAKKPINFNNGEFVQQKVKESTVIARTLKDALLATMK